MCLLGSPALALSLSQELVALRYKGTAIENVLRLLNETTFLISSKDNLIKKQA